MKKKQSQAPSGRARINEQDALEAFRKLHPTFEACWIEAQDFFEDDAPRMAYGAFARHMRDLLVEDPLTDFSNVLRYAETLMRDGTEDVQNIIAVYFIEALLAAADNHPKLISPLLKQLGPLSRAYALEWNEFLGAENKGLEK